MQVLVITDIHANYRALKAVLDKHSEADEVWCLGDIVLCGPRPSDCLELVRRRCTHVVRGNHDPAYAALVREIPLVCCDRDAPVLADLDYILGLPETVTTTAGGTSYFLVHWAPPPLDVSPDPYTKPGDLRRAFELAGTDVIVCGHSHVPMVTPFEDKTVINAGALGMPEDGDNRAQCFIIEDGMVHFDRVAYDLEAHADDYAKSHMPEEHADYYLRANRQGFVDSRGPRPGSLAQPRRNILAVNRCSLEEEQK